MSAAHLWEVEHPYHCEPGDYDLPFNRAGEASVSYRSWTKFTKDRRGAYAADLDLNLLFRWDWRKEDGEERLDLFFVQQRHGRLFHAKIAVTAADEADVTEWLARRARVVSAVWAPFLRPN